ncbi:MAG: DUF2029 domain-containing protein [Chloroflexi bacterium]|nr:DUF2029 domain-containing protein [Chloroflexota bacterium]
MSSMVVQFASAALSGEAFTDWRTYVNAVERLQVGTSIYAQGQLAGPYTLPDMALVGYAYPPASVPLFLPFTSYPGGLVAWLLLNVGLLVTGLYAVLRQELGQARLTDLALVLLLLALIRPFWSGLALGNVNVGLAGVLAWCWVIGRGRGSIALVAALGATVKSIPGVLVFWSTPRTFPRVAIGTAVTGVLLFLVSLPFVGLQSWFDYGLALSNAQPSCHEDTFIPSAACLLQPVFGVGVAKLSGIVFAVVLGGFALVSRSSIVAFALVTFALLAPVTDFHPHYLLMLYVLIVVAGVSWIGGRRRSDATTVSP